MRGRRMEPLAVSQIVLRRGRIRPVSHPPTTAIAGSPARPGRGKTISRSVVAADRLRSKKEGGRRRLAERIRSQTVGRTGPVQFTGKGATTRWGPRIDWTGGRSI